MTDQRGQRRLSYVAEKPAALLETPALVLARSLAGAPPLLLEEVYEREFENVWRSRESYLSNMAGFVEFHLLKGPVLQDHTLYSSHTTWVDKAAFEAWTKSEEFRRAHARADNKTSESLYLGHPKFEGFEVILSERKSSAAA